MSQHTANAAGASAGPQQRRHFFKRKKVCIFCQAGGPRVDYKDAKMLGKFTTERGRIIPRRITGLCAFHQRASAVAVKRARYLALMPYVVK
jgi:small subunit ribosomal protein S18